MEKIYKSDYIKIYKFDYIKTNNFFPSKLTIKRVKDKL